MKIVTATARTQGRRANDYNFCVEGEIVIPTLVICPQDRTDPDGPCGCGRAWDGLNSQRSTTTAVVRDLPLDLREYTEAIRSSLEDQGWFPGYVQSCCLLKMVTRLFDLAQSHPVGAVLERRLDVISRR